MTLNWIWNESESIMKNTWTAFYFFWWNISFILFGATLFLRRIFQLTHKELGYICFICRRKKSSLLLQWIIFFKIIVFLFLKRLRIIGHARQRFFLTEIFIFALARAFTCFQFCICRWRSMNANDRWRMRLGCNCDSEVACFPKGCLFSLPLCHLYPVLRPWAPALFGSFLAVHRWNLWTIRREREEWEKRRGLGVEDRQRAGSINRCS